MNTTEMNSKLIAAAAETTYLFDRETYRVEVSYSATGDTRYITAAHEWLPEFVIENEAGQIVSRRKTARGALREMIRIADREAQR